MKKRQAPRNFLEQLAELSNTAPEELDPENVGFEGTLSIEPSYDDDGDDGATMAPSSLRRKQATLMDDPAYAGKAATRKSLDLGLSKFVCTYPDVSSEEEEDEDEEMDFSDEGDEEDEAEESEEAEEDGSNDEDGEGDHFEGAESSSEESEGLLGSILCNLCRQ